ncbi:hypothetical protein EG329_012972 [Mollisiaceae sp. DMI_Dod_QoI]|nr:hypothetical protein EG329_012972 [Helotiales sp. DMI_Dod_QoI]
MPVESGSITYLKSKLAMNRSFKLNSGYSVPAVGLQTRSEQVKEAVTAALNYGYRHIDAASVYGNETVDPISEQIAVIDVPIMDTWKAMESLIEKRKVRGIGVGNFTKAEIESLLQTAKIPPAVNQIEAHAYLQLPDLLWLKQQNIVVEAYNLLGNNIYILPKAVDDPTVIALAKEMKQQPAQVLISWAIQRGTVVLPKSVTAERMKDTFQDSVLPKEVFDKITALDRHHRYNFPARLGLNIFGQVSQDSLKKSVEDWKEAQRKLKTRLIAN